MPDGLEMSQQKRPSEDVDHEDGKRPNPQQRTPRIRACKDRSVLTNGVKLTTQQAPNAKGTKSNVTR